MPNMLINKNVMFAQAKLNSLAILLDHQYIINELSNIDQCNTDLVRANLEAIFCRSIDIYHDTLHKLVMQVVDSLPLTNPHLKYPDCDKIIKKGNSEKDIRNTISINFGFKLGKLRNFAENLLFPINDNIEASVLIRNCIVHNNSQITSGLTDFLLKHSINETESILNDNTIKITEEFAIWSLNEIKETLAKYEEFINTDFNIPWDRVKTSSTEKVAFHDWYRKEQAQSID